jgi:hypothetical protein
MSAPGAFLPIPSGGPLFRCGGEHRKWDDCNSGTFGSFHHFVFYGRAGRSASKHDAIIPTWGGA